MSLLTIELEESGTRLGREFYNVMAKNLFPDGTDSTLPHDDRAIERFFWTSADGPLQAKSVVVNFWREGTPHSRT